MIIGLDVGGTHTDVVLLDADRLISTAKVPTDHEDLFQTVLRGIDTVSAGVAPDSIRRIVLSTTLTTNAVVQGNLPPVGVIVTAGPGIDPVYFQTGPHYHCVRGSIDHRGREREAVDPEEIDAIADRLERAGVRYAAVVGKFSTRNPAHELAIAGMMEARFKRVFMGHRFSGSLSFPRRIATAFLNASVYPIHLAFYTAVRRSLEEKGLHVPIRILKADGGNMNFEASIDFPAQTINSGPAASVMGAMVFASEEDECLVMDIGGTTTDMAVLVREAPLLDPHGIDLGGFKTLIRSLNTFSVGLGGDSAVRVDQGQLHIGPQRHGPPLAFGGTVPTPTDAMIILGHLPETGDPAMARRGFKALADAMGMDVESAAGHVFDETCRRILRHAEDMIARINRRPVYTVHEMLDGHQVNPRSLYVLGGPALPFARRIEALSEFRVGVVPRSEVANAIGAALARTTCDVTLFADTEQGQAVAPEEEAQRQITSGFRMDDAVAMAFDLLEEKAVFIGASPEQLDMEVVEQQSFNMVRGFRTTGRNIRIQAQIKPGLIPGFDSIITSLL